MRIYRALALALALPPAALGCDSRFEFDIPPRGGAGGGDGAGTGGGGSTSGGGGASASAGAPCGNLLACPASLHCLASVCVECAEHRDCESKDAPRCDPVRHRCVACSDDTDCGEGFTCDERANRCLRRCGEEVPCPATAHGCDERRGLCYQCDEDRECQGSVNGPRCAVDGSGCVTCRADTDCEQGHCDPLSGRCVACRDGKDCASQLCSPSTHECVAASDPDG